MITIRKSDQRGHFNFGWLDTKHTFSFGDYFDKNQMGFRGLRVINEDVVAPGQGFGRHPHQDMEIITYVLDGALEHRDSLGTGSVIHPGEVQRMSAGTGIRHSEFNASKAETVHFLQIWIVPEKSGLPPSYEQRAFPAAARGGLALAASRDGRDGSVTVHQDVTVYAGDLDGTTSVAHSVAGRRAWVHVARGSLSLNDHALSAGDGAAVSDERELVLKPNGSAEVLVFDLA